MAILGSLLMASIPPLVGLCALTSLIPSIPATPGGWAAECSVSTELPHRTVYEFNGSNRLTPIYAELQVPTGTILSLLFQRVC